MLSSKAQILPFYKLSHKDYFFFDGEVYLKAEERSDAVNVEDVDCRISFLPFVKVEWLGTV